MLYWRTLQKWQVRCLPLVLARQDRRRFPSGLMIARGQTVNRAAQWVIVQTKETDPKLIDKEVP